jgi:hypothetical protein
MGATENSAAQPEWMDEAAVALLGRAAGFSFAPEALAGIAEQLHRAHVIAAPLLSADLDEHVELGPVWRP